MNIFYLDEDPKVAAEFMCNKHVVKMIIETAQLLSTAHHIKPNLKIDYKNSEVGKLLKKKTHVNHPSAVWARDSFLNYRWLAKHGIALCQEYTYRYYKTHKLTHLLFLLKNNTPNFEKYEFYQPPQCMPEEFKVDGDSVKAYRNYYLIEKRNKIKCEWKIREKPFWWI